MTLRVRIVGDGRAGGSFAAALADAGWTVDGPLRRDDEIASAATGVELVLICVSDSAVASVAAAIDPQVSTVIAHVAGSLGLEVLEPHARRAAIHPLVSIPSVEVGTRRLRAGATFGIAGDVMASEVVSALGGTSVVVLDGDRALYHAAACIASNHLVALLGQAERVAAAAGVPLSAFVDLVRGTIDNVAELGPAAALTGPAARGDVETVARHVAVLDPVERPAYEVMSDLARRLAESTR